MTQHKQHNLNRVEDFIHMKVDVTHSLLEWLASWRVSEAGGRKKVLDEGGLCRVGKEPCDIDRCALSEHCWHI